MTVPTRATRSDPRTSDDPWSTVVGQPEAVARLQAATAKPVHAYLLVGPRGAGKRALARAFAAELLADGRTGDDRRRAVELALAEEHPDLVVVERAGASISAEQANEVIRLAGLSPVEASRKVLVLDEFHLIAPNVGPKLLKTIEEPPDGTIFLVLAEEVTADLVTIASRCVRIDLGAGPDDVVRARLEAEGIDSSVAADAAAAACGDLGRARLLATDPHLAFRRQAWDEVPVKLDGTGARVVQLVDELLALITEAQAPLDEQHAAELAALEERVERYGERGSGRKQLVDRHKREARRHRTDELRFGLTVLARRYRQALIDASEPARIVEAIGAIHSSAESLARNPNERLQLQALFLRLPPL